MKTRKFFVANSSSSSFAIWLKDLTAEQLEKIHNHLEIGKTIGTLDCDDWNEWCIEIDGEQIIGRAAMDNFDMRWFLDHIGVAEDKIEWGDF